MKFLKFKKSICSFIVLSFILLGLGQLIAFNVFKPDITPSDSDFNFNEQIKDIFIIKDFNVILVFANSLNYFARNGNLLGRSSEKKQKFNKINKSISYRNKQNNFFSGSGKNNYWFFAKTDIHFRRIYIADSQKDEVPSL